MRPLAGGRPVALGAGGSAGLMAYLGGRHPITACIAFLVSLCALGLLANRARVTTPLPGAIGVVLGLLSGVLVVGLWPRDNPVYGVNPGLLVAVLYVTGMAALVFGCLLAQLLSKNRSSSPPLSAVELDRRDCVVLMSIGVLAILLAGLNYATGEIPIFSNDINAARLNADDYGVAGTLWPLILPMLHFVIIASGVAFLNHGFDRRLFAIALLSVGVLVLNGSRSLILIPVLAFGLYVVETRRPRILQLGLLVGTLALAVGYIGQARESTATGESNSAVAESVVALDLSLATGPRVLELLVSGSDASLLMGRFLIADMGSFLRLTDAPSDRLVTEQIGRDPGVIGGSPPTVWGGLWLDFGVVGVVLGGLLIGALLWRSRTWLYQSSRVGPSVWFAYWAAYVVLSAYSYVSVRPSWVVVLLLACLLKGVRSESRATSQ